MDRADIAEMSCIAGVGGDVKPLVRTAKSGRDIIAIDGCPLACCKASLARHDVTPKYHFELSKFNIPKIQGVDPDPDMAKVVYDQLLENMK